jgi:hypothetical protein
MSSPVNLIQAPHNEALLLEDTYTYGTFEEKKNISQIFHQFNFYNSSNGFSNIPKGDKPEFKNWQIKTWDKNKVQEFLKKKYPELYKKYKTYPQSSCQSNIARLAILHFYGGLFATPAQKEECNLREWVKGKNGLLLALSPSEPKKAYLDDSLIGFCKNHPFLKRAIKKITSFNEKEFKNKALLRFISESTGKAFLNNTLAASKKEETSVSLILANKALSFDHPDNYRVYSNNRVDPLPSPHTNSGYDGPWIENSFYNYFMENKPKLNRTYIPVFWTDMQVANRGKEIKTSFLQNLDPNKKYFTVVQHSAGISTEEVPENVMIIGSGRASDLCIPLQKNQPPQIIEKPKKYFCTFFGSFTTDKIRPQMKKSLEKLAKERPIVIEPKNPKWEEFMERSIFSLCPRGVGPTSFRISEAISFNSIPIYIWEKELLLPYKDELNWEKDIGILINSKDIKKLPKILKSISPEEIRHRQKMMKKHYKKYYTYEGVCKYICEKLKS